MTCFSFKQFAVAAATVAGVLASSPSRADNDVWKTAASGIWRTGTNWVDGSAPSSIFDSAIFNRAGAYTVSFDVDPDPIGALLLSNAANVTFASSVRPGNPIPPRTLTLFASSLSGNLEFAGDSSLTLGHVTGGFPSTSHPFHLTVRGVVFLGSSSTLNLRFGSVLTSFGNGNLFSGNVNVSAGSLILNGDSSLQSTAAVTIAGAGSRLISQSLLTIGDHSNTGPGAALSISGGGRVECFNAEIGSHSTGTVTVTDSGSQWTTTNRLEIGGEGSGTVSIQPGGTVSVGQETFISLNGRLRLQGGIFDTAAFRIQGSGEFEWTSGTLRVGTFHGDLVNESGTLAPGHSAGSTTILGRYNQRNSGVLEIEIGGVSQGTQYDVVNVTQDAQLSGRLDLKMIGGFVPTASQNFIILNADTVTGAFLNVGNGQRLATVDGGGSFLVHYGPNSAFDPALVVLSNFALAGLLGDFNHDGRVNAADYVVWRKIDGTPAGFDTWRANFGATAGGAAAVAHSQSPTTVPEPSLLTFSLVATCGLFARRRLRRNCQHWNKRQIDAYKSR